MKILVDREDIQEVAELIYVHNIGGPPKSPHPASINRANKIIHRILADNPVDEQGLAI
jgi:hypothetical protein